jgi:hypothetical protein
VLTCLREMVSVEVRKAQSVEGGHAATRGGALVKLYCARVVGLRAIEGTNGGSAIHETRQAKKSRGKKIMKK